jgi:putative hydrolase of the HAD superfamily
LIRAVIFDFGNVLCFPPSQDKIARAARFCGWSEDAFLERFWRERLEYDAGRSTPLEYWGTVTGEPFASRHLTGLIAMEIDFWTDYDVRPFHWIADLRAAGVSTGILSNLPRVLGEDLRSRELLSKRFLDHFDHATLSYELLTVKPQAAIYRHAIEGLQVAPEEALFLDDKIANVQGAIDAGLRAELFTTWEDFRKRDVPGLYGLIQSR